MATPTSPDNAVSGPALDNRRIAAAAIDVAAPVLAAVAVAAAGLLTPAVALVLVGWTLYYFFAFESGAGQTLGKRMMSLKVVSADGGEPTMRQYAMRTLARVVDMPVIGLIVMLVTGDKRERLGDMAARTSIVDANATDRAPDAFDLAPLQAEPVAPKAKRSRPSLGGPALKLPSFGRKKAKAPAFPGPATPVPEEIVTEPEAPVGESPVAQPEPLPASPPEPVPEVKPFDPFAEDAPEPSVEVVAYGEPEPEPDAPELPAPEIMQRDEPEVEIVRDDPADEPPAPEPMTPTLPAEPPPAAAEYEQPLEPEPETEPEPESEPEHVEGIRDDGSSRVNVKPIETVSAMELLMRETEEQDRQGG